MKNISELQDELEVMFGSIITDMTDADFNLILSFILTNFASDFPEIIAKIYKLSDMTNVDDTYKVYLADIHDDLLEVKMLFPIKPPIIHFLPVYYENNPFMAIEETAAIQLASQYVNKMSSYYVPKKPLILTDTTGEYLVLTKDVVLIGVVERIIDINNIEEHIYSILRYYAYAKFIDFIINKTFGSMMDMNDKIFNMMYNSIQTDLSSGDFEGVQSVSLGALSVSFNNKINNYSSALSSMANNFSNPNFIKQMND